jgi:hypothetical protein
VTRLAIRANFRFMEFDYKHDLSLEDARARLQILGEYLKNRHGINVTWNGDRASVAGKYMVVSIDAQMTLETGVVRVTGKDPGMLWRNKAKSYLQEKLATYLDPSTPADALPRTK